MVVFSEGHKAETCRKGRIEVICGSMFSGKTEELIRRLKRATFARQRVEIFKPSIDVRYSEEKVVSHDNNSIPSTPVDSSASILLFTSEIDVVGIDEAQFFDEGLTEVCNELANNGIRVIVVGLDMDYKGIPFGPIPSLCAIADEVTKVHAICVKCGDLAYVSHRTVHNDKRVLLGEKKNTNPCAATATGKHLKKKVPNKSHYASPKENHVRQLHPRSPEWSCHYCHSVPSEQIKRSVTAFLHRLADCLPHLPHGYILSEPAPPAKPRAVYSGCHADPGGIGRHCILFFRSSHDRRMCQTERTD